MSDDLTRAVTEALGCEVVRAEIGRPFWCEQHTAWSDDRTCPEATRVARALTPVIVLRQMRAFDRGYDKATEGRAVPREDEDDMSDDLTSVIAEALDRRHHLNTADLAADIAAALTPLIEARVREARAEVWDEAHAIGAQDQVNLGRFNIKPTPNPYRKDETDA